MWKHPSLEAPPPHYLRIKDSWHDMLTLMTCGSFRITVIYSNPLFFFSKTSVNQIHCRHVWSTKLFFFSPPCSEKSHILWTSIKNCWCTDEDGTFSPLSFLPFLLLWLISLSVSKTFHLAAVGALSLIFTKLLCSLQKWCRFVALRGFARRHLSFECPLVGPRYGPLRVS